MAHVKIIWNEAEFRRLLEVETVPQAMWRAAGRTRDRAKRNASTIVDTGALRSSIVALRIHSRPGVWYEIGSPLEYAIFQHEGTANGGAGRIYPRRAKVLRFSGKGGTVFAKSVRGVKPTPFLTDALKSLSLRDLEP